MKEAFPKLKKKCVLIELDAQQVKVKELRQDH